MNMDMYSLPSLLASMFSLTLALIVGLNHRRDRLNIAFALFVGGISGVTLAKAIHLISPGKISENNFALVGMAGVMAAVMHAPLTGIFLTAEITGGYGLFIPLLITSTVAYVTIMRFEPHSVYTKRLAKRGELITHHKDK